MNPLGELCAMEAIRSLKTRALSSDAQPPRPQSMSVLAYRERLAPSNWSFLEAQGTSDPPIEEFRHPV